MRKILLVMLVVVLFAGCSKNDGEKNINDSDMSNAEPNTEETDKNEDNNDDSNYSPENDSNNSNDNNDEYVEHEEGLKLGETGTVVDNNEDQYEVTLNSVEYVDTFADMEPKGETHAVVNITVKNIGDESFNAENIFEPSFGPPNELEASLNSIYIDDDNIDQDLLKGEIAPGESVSGDHVYFVEKIVDNYDFVMGGKGTQIISYANWEVSDSEID